MVFGSGAFGRQLGHESGAVINGISTLVKSPDSPSLLPPCADMTKRQPSMSQEAGSHQTIWGLCDLGLPSLQNYEKLISVLYKLPSL